MKKTLGFYFAIVSAVLALAGLVTFFIYTGQGGKMDMIVVVATIAAILCELSLCLGEKAWSDFAGIAGAVLLALAMTYTVAGGLGNIADQFQGIVMFGKAELANMNFAMVGVYGVSIIAAIAACFAKKSQ